MTVTVQNVEIYDPLTLEDPALPGSYVVTLRVKANIQTSSPDCAIIDANVCICDAGGCLDGPYPMDSDPGLGENWFSSGVLSFDGILHPNDAIRAHVEATEECTSEDTGGNDSPSKNVPPASNAEFHRREAHE